MLVFKLRFKNYKDTIYVYHIAVQHKLVAKIDIQEEVESIKKGHHSCVALSWLFCKVYPYTFTNHKSKANSHNAFIRYKFSKMV